VQRTRRVRRTVPQEFAEFQGSCRGADAAAVSIDRSIDRTNERTDGRDESLVGFPITRRASSPLARGCTMVGNARRGIRALSRVSGAPRRSRARLLHYSRACFAFASLVTPWKRILRERFPLFIQHSWTIDGEKRLRSVSPYRRI